MSECPVIIQVAWGQAYRIGGWSRLSQGPVSFERYREMAQGQISGPAPSGWRSRRTHAARAGCVFVSCHGRARLEKYCIRNGKAAKASFAGARAHNTQSPELVEGPGRKLLRTAHDLTPTVKESGKC